MQLASYKSLSHQPEGPRLALIFAVVYFSQGMWYLPNLSITFFLKETLHLSATETATFFLIVVVPWLIKPVYGLLSDSVPLFGRRRKSYFLLTTGLAVLMGGVLCLMHSYTYWSIAIFFMLMGFGLAFTDVLIDALMVENGQRLRLTGAFQSVQWAAISLASVLVGIGGGWLAQNATLWLTFLLATIFPLLSLVVGILFLREPRVAYARGQFQETWKAIRGALVSYQLWVVAGFIFFYNFSPSFGPSLVYYASDRLEFSKLFLGALESLQYLSGILGSLVFFMFSTSFSSEQRIRGAIGGGVIATLAYLAYQGPASAIALALAFGSVSMMIQLTFLDLAARACPKQAEGTFFALLMSVYNAGVQLSQVTGGWLYDALGYHWLILISAGSTALCWLLLPLLKTQSAEFEVLSK